MGNSNIKLFQHQLDALERVKEKNRVAFFHDMGLGKTYTGSEKMIRLGKKVNLVVCQKSKVQDWVDHFDEYYDCRLYDLTKKKDLFNFLNDVVHPDVPSIGVINYDLLFSRHVL